jgi:hypothetical protein
MAMHDPSLFAGQRQVRNIRGVSPKVSGAERGPPGRRNTGSPFGKILPSLMRVGWG